MNKINKMGFHIFKYNKLSKKKIENVFIRTNTMRYLLHEDIIYFCF